ncbi:MAG: ABC transporter ATP-binding protein [Candidatus Thermoplasmatota archaeon]|nr:ABC transporter ATP-binding protein [Candidatus Thermoplasmatota archaeon]
MISGIGDENILLYVSDLKKYFPITTGRLMGTKGYVKALDGVTFTLREGESLGIVGETGCGKTTLGRTILDLIQATDGNVYFNLPKEEMLRIMELENKESTLREEGKTDEDPELLKVLKELAPLRREFSTTKMSGRKLSKLRRYMQPVFQDPFSSLDPRKIVRSIIGEPMKVLLKMKVEEIIAKELEIIEEIGLSEDHLYRFPHEFSGGQRQRIGIARAISIEPKLLILDEPTSALDVSVQAQILNILRDLQNRRGLSYLFISHHLNVIRMMSDRVGVMYLGKMVELADTEELFTDMLHPYTKALLSAIPIPDPETKINRIVLEGEIPNPSDPPKGCHFHPRCPVAMKTCGWSPVNLSNPLAAMLDPVRNQEAKDIVGIQEIIVDEDKNYLQILFAPESPVSESNLQLVKDLIEKESLLKGGVVFEAIKDVFIESESNSLIITMVDPETPKLKEVRKGHFVSCLLYDYNYFDQETSGSEQVAEELISDKG